MLKGLQRKTAMTASCRDFLFQAWLSGDRQFFYSSFELERSAANMKQEKYTQTRHAKNIYRSRKFQKKKLIALALVSIMLISYVFGMVVSSAPAGQDYYISGRTANYRYNNNSPLYGSGVDPTEGAGQYDSPLVIRKTVEQLTGDGFDERDFELMLTATGYDWTSAAHSPVNVVFVIDATSSMGTGDIPTQAGAMTTRSKAARDAAKAYITALYQSPGGIGRVIDTAIVSFGNSARVHVDKDADAAGMGGIGVSTGTDKYIGDVSVTDPNTIYSQFKSAFTVTDGLFYDDASTLTGIVDRISTYSNTNIESGLLLADYLIGKKSNSASAVNIVMLITDGEANSSSTLVMLENHDALNAVWGSVPYPPNYSASGEPLAAVATATSFTDKYDIVMSNTAKLSADPGFVNSLYPALSSINFFAGVFHRLDRSLYPSSFDGVAGAGTPADEMKLESFARYAFWLAEKRVPYYTHFDVPADDYSVKGATLIPPEGVFTVSSNGTIYNGRINNSGGPGTYAQLAEYFIYNKAPRSMLVDYHESRAPENVTGSDGAKELMKTAAAALKNNSSTTVFATGIGESVVNPEQLEVTATDPSKFYICSDTAAATVKNAEALRKEFEMLGTTASLHGVRDLTITDLIPLRASGVGNIDDDTFTVNGNAIKARLWHYEGGAAKAADWVIFDKNTAGPEWTVNITGTTATVAYNYGMVYSEDVAKDKQSPEYPYMAELRIQIRANDGVVSSSSNNVPDIDTNKTGANAAWRDISGNKNMQYPIPKVYFAPPRVVVPPPPVPTETEPEKEPEPEPEEPSPSPSSVPDPEDPEDPEDEEDEDDTEDEDETDNHYIPPIFIPGGNDPEVPPAPTASDNTLEWDDELEMWIEFDEDGVPLGGWYWDDDEEMWIFDDDIPLGEFSFEEEEEEEPDDPEEEYFELIELPQTGASAVPQLLCMIGFALIGIGVPMSFDRKKSREK